MDLDTSNTYTLLIPPFVFEPNTQYRRFPDQIPSADSFQTPRRSTTRYPSTQLSSPLSTYHYPVSNLLFNFMIHPTRSPQSNTTLRTPLISTPTHKNTITLHQTTSHRPQFPLQYRANRFASQTAHPINPNNSLITASTLPKAGVIHIRTRKK